PCPICEGHDTLRRHRGERCAGFISDDGRFAFCTREEYRGALDPTPTATGQTYKHRLDGHCRCGRGGEHGIAFSLPPRPRQMSEQHLIERLHTGPLPLVY